MKDLAVALDCENEDLVLEGFIQRYDVSIEEAKDIFKETKKWLWLAANNKSDQPLFIDRPLLVIDEMWHNFILYSRQYYNFCFKHFKNLLHHDPTPLKEKERARIEFEKNPQKAKAERDEKLKKQFTSIYDQLGPETLVKWYETIPSKYTPEYLASIKKH